MELMYLCMSLGKEVKTKQKKNADLLLCTVDKLIFVGPLPAGPHTLVLPKNSCMVIKFLEREREASISQHTTTRNNSSSSSYFTGEDL